MSSVCNCYFHLKSADIETGSELWLLLLLAPKGGRGCLTSLCLMFVYVCFVLCLRKDWFCGLKGKEKAAAVVLLNVLGCRLTYQGQTETSA